MKLPSPEYIRTELFEKYGSSGTPHPRIYFPYALKTQTLSEFQRQNRVDVCIPGLNSSRPDIVNAIENLQHWSADFSWLPDFMDLNNENKHQRLTPQIRKEVRELRISSGGASAGIFEESLISVEPGVLFQIGNAIIPGGQTIDTNHPPITQGSAKVEIITWVSFHFSSNDQAVLPFLKQSIQGVKKIVETFSVM